MSPLPFALAACRPDPTRPPHHETPTGTDEPTVTTVHVPGPLRHIRMSDPIACADPAARDEAPFDLVEEGDWARRGGTGGAWGAAVADFDGDGWPDVVLPAGPSPMLFTGAADGLHLTADWLPEQVFQGEFGGYRAATPADLDGDGDLDVVYVGRDVTDLLLLNDGSGHFTSQPFGKGPRTMGAALADLDGDGDLDMALATGSTNTSPVLMLNDGATHFGPRDELLPERFGFGGTFVVGIVDLNQDGLPDLYRANDAGPWGPGNLVAWNRGGVWEAGKDDQSGLDLEICSMGLGIGDINGDQIPDLALSDCESLHLLESTPVGIWTDHAEARALSIDLAHDQGTPWGMELEDLDNDGDLDVFVAYGYLDDVAWEQPQSERDGVYLQQDDGTFVEVGEDWGFALGQARGFAMADINNDGWMDLIQPDWHGKPSYYRSRCGAEAWLRVQLEEPGRNPFAIGAKVVATTDREQVRWIHAGGTSVSSGSPPEAHFGLGDADTADLEVTWPDGEIQRWSNVPTRRIVTLLRH